MAWIERRVGKKTGTRYLVRWREPGGETQSSKVVPTMGEARTLKAKIENELRGGNYVTKALRDRPFGDYAVEVLESSYQLEASTLYQRTRTFERWIGPGLGDEPMAEIDASTIRRFFTWMRSQGASDKTIGRVRAQLTNFFARAVTEGILTRNPVKSVPAPKTQRREIRVMTPEEVQAVADALPGHLRMIPLLSAWGTLRLGEVAALTEDCIDGDRITIKQAIGTAGSTRYLKGPKTPASRRTVQLPSWVAAELREHVLRYRREDGFLFKDSRGNLIAHQAWWTTWRRALREAGFEKPYPRPHDLRHTAVALMIKAGAHPKEIQARCGHATISETMDTYGALFPGHEERLVKALEAFRPAGGAEVIELRDEA